MHFLHGAIRIIICLYLFIFLVDACNVNLRNLAGRLVGETPQLYGRSQKAILTTRKRDSGRSIVLSSKCNTY